MRNNLFGAYSTDSLVELPESESLDGMATDDALGGIVPAMSPEVRPMPAPVIVPKPATPPRSRTVGIIVKENSGGEGVLAACPQPPPEKTQPDWYMPGYRRIDMRLCDGQWVTCGNSYPCSTPTPKDGTPAWETGYGQGLDQLGESGGYDYYASPDNGQQAATAPKWKQH